MTLTETRARDYANTKANNYADPGYQPDGKKRYAIDNADQVRAAWSYINQSGNASKYTAAQLARIKNKIRAAAKKFGVEINDSGSRSVPLDALGRERLTVKLETRAINRTDPTAPIRFTGHAAVFNQRTWIGAPNTGFYEQVEPTAFNRTLQQADVRFLINHNPDLILARTTSGTLRLSTDDRGLVTDADLAPTSYGNDLAISMERGDVREMSFSFLPEKDGATIERDEQTGAQVRTLHAVKLFDVSAVTYPAYDGTDAALRSKAFDVLAASLGLDDDARMLLVAGIAEGRDMRTLLRAAVTDTPDLDESPVALAQALDATLDEIVEALTNGEAAQALDLAVGAETTSDQLIELLGGVDADDTDTQTTAPGQPARSAPVHPERRPANTTDVRTRPFDWQLAQPRMRELAATFTR